MGLDLEKRRIVYMSPTIEKISGFTAEETVKLPLKMACPEEHLKTLINIFSRTADDYGSGTGKGRYPDTERMEWQRYHKDGHLIWVEVDFSVIRDDTGRALEILYVSRNVSDRKALEDELKNRNSYIESILDNLPVGIGVPSDVRRYEYLRKRQT